MEISIIESLSEVTAAEWDRLNDAGDPFLAHAFLAGLEQHDCLGPQGWYPSHVIVKDDDHLVAAMPMYLKDNSYGEFVFDWSWADAYQRAGGRYYPKFVSAIPFTPATGRRVLLDEQVDAELIFSAIVSVMDKMIDANNASSFHCLFPTTEQSERFAEQQLLIRRACQYHWFNQDYATFDDFLAALNSKRRKQIRRERRDANAAGLKIELLHGDDIRPHHWQAFHKFYCSTFYRKWGEPRLTEAFFHYLSEAMPDAPLLALASRDDEYVAGSFSMRGGDSLYGRHWGCSEHYKQLHFELCYYQTIDYCIREKLARFDAGAQGEHKIMRGFQPVKTWSAHYIADPRFRDAIDDFLRRESQMIDQYIDDLAGHSAYKRLD